MRRNFVSVRSSFAVLVVVGLALATWGSRSPVRAQDNAPTAKPKASVEGAWKQVGQINPTTGKLEKFPDGVEMTKLITGGRFAWIVVGEGKVLASAGGTYTIKDDVFTEKVSFVGSDSHNHLMGKSFAYPIKFEDGKWHLKASFKLDDREMAIDELWERCRQIDPPA
jgi:hypothetical protein